MTATSERSLFTATPPPATLASDVLRRLAMTWTKIALAVAFLSCCYDWRPFGSPEHFFLWRHDLPVLAAATALVWGVALMPPAVWPAWLTRPLGLRGAVWLAALAVLIAGGLGVGLVFEHFTLSLDEAMADFDAKAFANGQLMARMPDVWRPFGEALQPVYMQRADGYWSSSYLPINAAMRALGQVLHARDWVNPLLTAMGVLATFAVGRRLWPEHPRRAIAAALLLSSSPQVVTMGMSAYAMPAHLAFNMVWLWLFLRNRPLSDLGAIIVGFFAVGIHQLLFHPLFVGFFILDLWLTKRWTRAAVFTAAYGVICVFWVLYYQVLYKLVGVTPDAVAAVGAGNLLQRIQTELAKLSMENVGRFAENFLRFVAWQSPIMLPLALTGALAARKKAGPMRAMALGFVATGLAMLILVPSQTHGWGYRYLHGFLGGLALMAVEGWLSLTRNLEAEQKGAAERALAALALLAVVAFLPLRAWQARQFSHPYAQSMKAIVGSGADIVLIDNGKVGFDAGTVVHNDPFLKAKPTMLFLAELSPDQLDQICKLGTVWVFDASNPAAAGMLTFEGAPWAPRMAQLRQHLAQTGCVR